jgi:hypothetical protein
MTLTVVTVVALVAALPVAADDWARDRAAAASLEALDPAIRTAVAARLTAVPPVPSVTETPAVVVSADGFEWLAAGVGAAVGFGIAWLVLLCVTLMRHDGRLRSV